jgi:hypothetical protein
MTHRKVETLKERGIMFYVPYQFKTNKRNEATKQSASNIHRPSSIRV